MHAVILFPTVAQFTKSHSNLARCAQSIEHKGDALVAGSVESRRARQGGTRLVRRSVVPVSVTLQLPVALKLFDARSSASAIRRAWGRRKIGSSAGDPKRYRPRLCPHNHVEKKPLGFSNRHQIQKIVIPMMLVVDQDSGTLRLTLLKIAVERVFSTARIAACVRHSSRIAIRSVGNAY